MATFGVRVTCDQEFYLGSPERTPDHDQQWLSNAMKQHVNSGGVGALGWGDVNSMKSMNLF